jgi:hypothetical protein
MHLKQAHPSQYEILIPPSGEIIRMSLRRFVPLLVFLVATAGASFAVPPQTDQSAKQDMKDAGHDTKNAAQDTGDASKKTAQTTGHTVKKTSKQVAHKSAQKTQQGAQKVADKTEDKTKPPNEPPSK